jgi:hypothetical protein
MGLVVELVEDKLISRYSGSVKALHQYVHVIQWKKAIDRYLTQCKPRPPGGECLRV